MNQFLNQLKGFVNKHGQSGSVGTLLLAGFGFMALNSYYYGTPWVTQLMWGTMPSSSTS